MTEETYLAPEILELGDARRLTKGNYPDKAETYGHTDKVIKLDQDLKSLAAD